MYLHIFLFNNCYFIQEIVFIVSFQPDISKYSADILPLLFERLVNTSAESGQASPSISRTYYALETFCENLGNKT